MQYSTFVLAAAVAATANALPGSHKARHHHHRRQPAAQPEAAADAYDTSNVDWSKALANVNWATVVYTGDAPVATTTVAVVGTTLATLVSTTSAPAAGNVAAAAVSSATTAAGRAALTTQTPIAAAATSAASSGLKMSASGSDYSIQVVNNCPHQIWQAGWQTNMAGGVMDAQVRGNAMSAGSSITLAVPKNALGVQLWARTGCTGSGSSFHCDVGDCQGFQCSSIIWQKGPIMAEFGSGLNTDMYNTDITAYDISAIPGNNVGVKIVPSISSCLTKHCPVSGCDNTQAWHLDSDMALGSPADTTCSNAANFVVTFCP